MIIYTLSLVPTSAGPEFVTNRVDGIYRAFNDWHGDSTYTKTQEQFISELTAQRYIKHKDVIVNCFAVISGD